LRRPPRQAEQKLEANSREHHRLSGNGRARGYPVKLQAKLVGTERPLGRAARERKPDLPAEILGPLLLEHMGVGTGGSRQVALIHRVGFSRERQDACVAPEAPQLPDDIEPVRAAGETNVDDHDLVTAGESRFDAGLGRIDRASPPSGLCSAEVSTQRPRDKPLIIVDLEGRQRPPQCPPS
jgi:hypothetical protein